MAPLCAIVIVIIFVGQWCQTAGTQFGWTPTGASYDCGSEQAIKSGTVVRCCVPDMHTFEEQMTAYDKSIQAYSRTFPKSHDAAKENMPSGVTYSQVGPSLGDGTGAKPHLVDMPGCEVMVECKADETADQAMTRYMTEGLLDIPCGVPPFFQDTEADKLTDARKAEIQARCAALNYKVPITHIKFGFKSIMTEPWKDWVAGIEGTPEQLAKYNGKQPFRSELWNNEIKECTTEGPFPKALANYRSPSANGYPTLVELNFDYARIIGTIPKALVPDPTDHTKGQRWLKEVRLTGGWYRVGGTDSKIFNNGDGSNVNKNDLTADFFKFKFDEKELICHPFWRMNTQLDVVQASIKMSDVCTGGLYSTCDQCCNLDLLMLGRGAGASGAVKMYHFNRMGEYDGGKMMKPRGCTQVSCPASGIRALYGVDLSTTAGTAAFQKYKETNGDRWMVGWADTGLGGTAQNQGPRCGFVVDESQCTCCNDGSTNTCSSPGGSTGASTGAASPSPPGTDATSNQCLMFDTTKLTALVLAALALTI